MLQSSETTNSLRYLGYPDQTITNNYYTAQVSPGIGVAVALMKPAMVMVQFFPWDVSWSHSGPETGSGHARFSCFIAAKATMAEASAGDLYTKWPFELVDQLDILMIKCLIEETIKRMGAKPDEHQRDAADPEAGTAVE